MVDTPTGTPSCGPPASKPIKDKVTCAKPPLMVDNAKCNGTTGDTNKTVNRYIQETNGFCNGVRSKNGIFMTTNGKSELVNGTDYCHDKERHLGNNKDKVGLNEAIGLSTKETSTSLQRGNCMNHGRQLARNNGSPLEEKNGTKITKPTSEIDTIEHKENTVVSNQVTSVTVITPATFTNDQKGTIKSPVTDIISTFPALELQSDLKPEVQIYRNKPTIICDKPTYNYNNYDKEPGCQVNNVNISTRNRNKSNSSKMPSSDAPTMMQDIILCPHKLLDKLLVVCPNVDYCEEVLPRCDLQAHLANRCRGAITKCVKSDVGCTFQGPRSALQSHLWECPFRDVDSGTGSLPRLPVLEGEITTIDIQRGCYDLGVSFVGGCDTPLVCVVIQEIFPDGVVAKDNRLQPGDQILEVNGIDLTQVSHREAMQALKQVYPICRLTVYREKAEDQSTEKEEILKISLPKIPGRQLGIKLVGKKNGAGLFILEMIEGGLAAADNRLKKDDRILEINCQDMTFGTQEQASQIIQASVDKVQIVVARKSRPQTPDIVRSTSRDCLTNCVRKECILGYMPYKCKEKVITIHKDASETLGISVAGGVGSPRGDIPIYVTNVQSQGCLARSRQVKKGDVLLTINGRSLLDLTHTDAVGVLKAAAEARQVVLKVLEGPETTEGIGNFTPSWKFWLAMPVVCHTTRTVTLERAATGTLGFSIVGGSDAAQGPQPIYIKSIVPNTPAGKDARLRSGDLLLSVNNHSLESVTHTQAVILLKNSRGDVTLRVVSWPGTVV